MRRKEMIQLLKSTKKYGTKVTAVAIAATLAFAAVPVETLASEPVIEMETIEEEETNSIVAPAAETVGEAQEVVTDEVTDDSLADAAEDLEEASDSLNEAEDLKEDVTDSMTAVEEANDAFVAAIEEAKKEAENVQDAADDATAAKDVAVSAETESEAQDAAAAAGESAEAAQSAVDAAQGKVDSAQAEYDKAYAAYQEALKKAEEAENALANAGESLDGAGEDVDAAKTAAEEFKAEADAALEAVNDEGMSLILAQHDKVAEIYNAEGKTENYWAATRTLNNMIVEYYLLAGNADVNKDSIRFGAEYDKTEFTVITDYEKNEDGTYKVDEDGNYIPVYSTISYNDNTKDDTGEVDWIKADNNQANRTVCVYEEQARDEQGVLLYDTDGNPVMKTVVKYYNYKWNDDGTIYIVEKVWNSEDAEEIIAEVPAVEGIDPIAPTYEYVNGEQVLVRDENDAKQVVKTAEDGTEIVGVPDENDARGSVTTLPENSEVKNGNTTTTTTYEKGDENTTYAFGDTQVFNTEGTGATTVTDYDKNKDGSKDDMKRDVDALLQEYDVNAGYAIRIHYETWFQDKTYTIDDYNSKAGFWASVDDWFADLFGTAEYTIEVVHTEDTVEGIIGTTTADYTVTTTEVTTNSGNKSDDGYKNRNAAKSAAEQKKNEVLAQYKADLGVDYTTTDGNVYTFKQADGTVVELKFEISTDDYWDWFKKRYEYNVDYTATTTKTTTTTENRTIATKAYGAQYYSYTMTDPGREGVPAVVGKDAAYGTKIVWSEDLNNRIVDEKSPAYQAALADQEAKIKEYTDAATAAADALDAVAEAQAAVDEAKEAYNNLKNDSDATWAKLREYAAIVNAAKAKLEEAVANAEELQAVADEAKAAYEEAVASLARFAKTDDNMADTNTTDDTVANADTNVSVPATPVATVGTNEVPQVAEAAATQAAATTTTRTAATRTAQVAAADAEEENLTTIEDEEVPLAAEEEEDVDTDAELTTIGDEEVPLAAEKESTQKNFWWWILLVIAVVTGTFFVVRYQKNKKNNVRA